MKQLTINYNSTIRERALNVGTHYLSEDELLAILIKTGTQHQTARQLASTLLDTVKDLSGLCRASLDELTAVSGIGKAKALQIKAAIELGRRIATFTTPGRNKVTSPGDVSALLMPTLRHLDQEHFCVIMINTRNEIIAIETLYVGTVNSTIVRPAEIFRAAMRCNAVTIIIAHNHPSGDPSPSPEDVNITRKIAGIGKEIQIEVLDHVIIGDGRYTSLKERGLGF